MWKVVWEGLKDVPRKYAKGLLYMLRCVLSFLPIYSGRQACGSTSRVHAGGRSHRISHPPSLCCACLNLSREKDSAVPFPRRP